MMSCWVARIRTATSTTHHDDELLGRADKNGYIDRDELRSSFARLGIALSDDDVAAMMSEADTTTNQCALLS